MIVISDFDDTLCPRDNAELFQKNLIAIQEFRQAGNQFCLATGRGHASLERIWPDYDKYLDYIILDNGAMCFNSDGKAVFEYTIPEDLTLQLSQNIASKFVDEIALVYYYNSREWPEIGKNITKVRCWTTSISVGDEVLNDILSKEYHGIIQAYLAKNIVMSSCDWISEPEKYRAFVDIMSIQAGKENAINQLLSILPQENVITIGDDTNDIGMLKEYDGYAVKTANPEVLSVISPNHIVDSVADLLYKLITH